MEERTERLQQQLVVSPLLPRKRTDSLLLAGLRVLERNRLQLRGPQHGTTSRSYEVGVGYRLYVNGVYAASMGNRQQLDEPLQHHRSPDPTPHPTTPLTSSLDTLEASTCVDPSRTRELHATCGRVRRRQHTHPSRHSTTPACPPMCRRERLSPPSPPRIRPVPVRWLVVCEQLSYGFLVA